MTFFVIFILFFYVVCINCQCHDVNCDPNSETCCPDKKLGGICCIEQETQCCKPTANYPSRCCPQWNVCCDESAGSRYGCCNPLSSVHAQTLTTTSSSSSSNTAYALFDVDTLEQGLLLESLVIDLTTGSYSNKKVSPTFPTWQETTRPFVFDTKRKLFYLPQANMTGLAPTYDVTLFTVDPTSGSLSVTPVRGVKGLVTGFAYEPVHDQLYLATYSTTDRSQGYYFYAIDHLDRGSNSLTATRISGLQFGTRDDFSGWFDTAHGDFVYRVGLADPESGTADHGVQSTKVAQVSGGVAMSKFAVAPSFSQASLNRMMAGTGRVLDPSRLSVVGLASQLNSSSLAGVSWTTTGNSVSVWQRFSDLHETPGFGQLIAAVNGNTYAGLAVVNSDLSNKLDRWAIVTFSLSSSGGGSGPTVTQHTLSPWMLAEINSAVGLGV